MSQQSSNVDQPANSLFDPLTKRLEEMARSASVRVHIPRNSELQEFVVNEIERKSGSKFDAVEPKEANPAVREWINFIPSARAAFFLAAMKEIVTVVKILREEKATRFELIFATAEPHGENDIWGDRIIVAVRYVKD